MIELNVIDNNTIPLNIEDDSPVQLRSADPPVNGVISVNGKQGMVRVDELTDEVKRALLLLASKVTYVDDDGQDYYDVLENALYKGAELMFISATYTQSGTVLDTDTLNSLKDDLVVTATYDDSSTVDVTDYTLSGTLVKGTSTITVGYAGKTTTFTVNVTKNTTAVIEEENKTHTWSSNKFVVSSRTNAGITKKYDIPATNILYPAGVIVYAGTVIANDVGAIIVYNDGGTNVGNVSEKISGDSRWCYTFGSTYTEFSQSWTLQSGNYTKITFDLDMRYLDYSYMYDKTTGLVFFAGVNTPYFGMDNISEANE